MNLEEKIESVIMSICELVDSGDTDVNSIIDKISAYEYADEVFLQMARATNVSMLNMMASLISPDNHNSFFRGKRVFPFCANSCTGISEILHKNGRYYDADSVMGAIKAMQMDGFLTFAATPFKDSSGCEIFNARCTPKVLKKYRKWLDR